MSQRPKPLDDSASWRAWFGKELQNWRNVRKRSQSSVAAEVNISATYMSKIEKAERRCPDKIVRPLDDVLEAGGALVRLWRRVKEEEERTAAQADARDDQLHVGADEIGLIRAAASDLDAIDQQFGGGGVWRSAQAHLMWLSHVIERGSYDPRLERELHQMTGAITVSLGWYSYDAGRQAEARAHFTEGLTTATMIEDLPLACRTLSVMARQAVDFNRGREAVRFSRQAQQQTARWAATPRVHALLAIREAQGHARTGDADACKEALSRAWREWERGPRDTDPDWTYFLNRAELICLEGMCLLDLGQPHPAQRLLTHSATLQDRAHSRNLGMALGRLSVAALEADDLDHSVEAVRQTLSLCDAGMNSTRNIAQLRLVHRGIARHAASREVGDVLDRIKERIT